jgi:hypothetical protein
MRKGIEANINLGEICFGFGPVANIHDEWFHLRDGWKPQINTQETFYLATKA